MTNYLLDLFKKKHLVHKYQRLFFVTKGYFKYADFSRSFFIFIQMINCILNIFLRRNYIFFYFENHFIFQLFDLSKVNIFSYNNFRSLITQSNQRPLIRWLIRILEIVFQFKSNLLLNWNTISNILINHLMKQNGLKKNLFCFLLKYSWNFFP